MKDFQWTVSERIQSWTTAPQKVKKALTLKRRAQVEMGLQVRRKITGKSKCRYVLARARHTMALRWTLTNLSSTTTNTWKKWSTKDFKSRRPSLVWTGTLELIYAEEGSMKRKARARTKLCSTVSSRFYMRCLGVRRPNKLDRTLWDMSWKKQEEGRGRGKSEKSWTLHLADAWASEVRTDSLEL